MNPVRKGGNRRSGRFLDFLDSHTINAHTNAFIDKMPAAAEATGQGSVRRTASRRNAKDAEWQKGESTGISRSGLNSPRRRKSPDCMEY